MPLVAAAAVLVLAALGAGGYLLMGRSGAQPPARQAVAAQLAPRPTPPAQVLSEPIAVSASPQTAATSTAVAPDEAARNKAFEDAVNQKLQAEMMKLQNDFLAGLKKQQPANAPVTQVAAAAPVQLPPTTTQEERPPMTASELTAARREEARQEQAAAEARTPAVAVPAVTQTAQPPAATTSSAAPAPAAAVVREGDVIDIGSLDVVPKIVRAVKPQYPPLAARQKLAATIFLTVFVGETGEVLDVRVLRRESRFGMNEAAVRAIRATRFSSPMKDGKRVRTWFPQTVSFQP
jgi:protein TonB